MEDSDLPEAIVMALRRALSSSMLHAALPHEVFATSSRQMSKTGTLPYRIRAPLAKLKERKKTPQMGREAGLGDGEKLESENTNPDYVRLALTSRVYDMLQESPMQHASGLSQRLQAQIFLKREDLLPSFSYKIRGAYNMLAHTRSSSGGLPKMITYSVGSQGHSMACAAAALGVEATVVMPERTPIKRRNAIERQGAKVIIHGKGLIDAKMEALRLSENSPELTMVQPHEDPQVIAGQATAGLEIVRQIGPLLEGIKGSKDLDAVFITAGGSSLLAGVAAVIKQITPRVKVIGVEAEGADLLAR